MRLNDECRRRLRAALAGWARARAFSRCVDVRVTLQPAEPGRLHNVWHSVDYQFNSLASSERAAECTRLLPDIKSSRTHFFSSSISPHREIRCEQIERKRDCRQANSTEGEHAKNGKILWKGCMESRHWADFTFLQLFTCSLIIFNKMRPNETTF